jgi:ribose-phosphate pyrophosphokinase
MELKIFSGRSNLPLAEDIAQRLGKKLGEIYIHNFPSGESYCQFQENIRGCDIFLIQGITKPANESLMDLLIMADAARRASAGRITAVLPYFGYARQDRKEKSRVPISAKLVLDIVQAAGIDRVLTMDLHSPQICGFTNLPFDHLTFEPVLLDYLKTSFEKEKLVIVAPDVGAVKRAEKYAKLLDCDMAFISKKRVGDETVGFNNFVGDVKDKTAIIIDDLTESCGTLIQAATIAKTNGADKVICAVSHFCFTDVGMDRLTDHMPNPGRPTIEKSVEVIDQFIHSNTVNYWWSKKYKPADIISLNVGGLFAKAIHSIHTNQSVSDLFV